VNLNPKLETPIMHVILMNDFLEFFLPDGDSSHLFPLQKLVLQTVPYSKHDRSKLRLSGHLCGNNHASHEDKERPYRRKAEQGTRREESR
jgi:hypothetical protein